MENSVNVYIHTFISIYIYMYIYWYNWYTILSNPHKHCVSECATFSKSLAQCATRLVHPPWLITPNRTNLSSPIFHFLSLSCMYHFRYLPSGTLFCPFLPFFTISARPILNKLQTVLPALVALTAYFLPSLMPAGRLYMPWLQVLDCDLGGCCCLIGGGLFGGNLVK